MQEFESIRPYRDAEVPAVVRRLLADPKLIAAAAELFTPRLADLLPNVARRIAGLMLNRKARELTTVDEIQRFLAGYFGRLIEKTISELTCTGLDGLKPDRPYLFISNHRDIVMDTGLVNYVLHRAGFETPEAAVGDNLLTEPLVADLMRLNKSFVVERSVTGKRAVYRALTRTSNYIRTALEAGHSVWIAQKEGRSKDGFDRTDPAVVKMLALAWRKEADTFGAWLDRISLVPVAISYELDPCDVQKAHELAVRARQGDYQKGPHEDLASIVTGMTGFKGRVHLHFSAPLKGEFDDADELARALDQAIVGGLRVFPTQIDAARRLGLEPAESAGSWLDEVKRSFEARIDGCPDDERTFLLAGYGNLIRNRAELGL
jgi:glycerol-3-phosphate O-acyltransferase